MGRRNRKKKSNNEEKAISASVTKTITEKTEISPNCIIETSELMGRYIIAKTDIPPGTVLLEEDPLVVGPSHGSSPLCVACYTPVHISNCARCKSCEWPLCKINCKNIGKQFGHGAQECDILKLSSKKPTNDSAMYNILTPLRILLLKNKNEHDWNTITSMEAHSKLRKKTDMWKSDEIIINYIKGFERLSNETDDVLHSICGYIQVNGFGVEGKELTALFPSAFLFSHNCIPNTTHVINGKFHLVLRSTTFIKRGEPITISYCNTLHGTMWRRQYLQGSKFFDCNCSRCSDRTELNTWISALKCDGCKTGYLLPINPLANLSDWKCQHCGKLKDKHFISNFVGKPLEEVEEAKDASVESIENTLRKYQDSLHPNHFVNLLLKLKLSQLYGKTHDYIIHSMSEKHLKRKIGICKEIIKIFDTIEPGMSRIRGITLYELHAPVLVLGTIEFNKNGNKKKFESTIKEVKNYLQEAHNILKIEDPASGEGLIAKAAADALQQMLVK